MIGSEWSSTLTKAVFEAAPVQQVLDLCARCLGSPVRFTAFEHPEKGILSSDYPMEDYWDWKRYCLQQQDIIPPYKQFLTDQYGLRLAGRPFIHDLNGLIRRRRIICITYIGERRVGHLSLPEMETPLENFDMDAIAYCAHIAALSWVIQTPAQPVSRRKNPLWQLLHQPDQVPREVEACLQSPCRLIVMEGREPRGALTVAAAAEHLADLCRTSLYCTEENRCVLLAEQRQLRDETAGLTGQLLAQAGAACCVSPCLASADAVVKWHRRMERLGSFAAAAAGTMLYAEDCLEEVLFGDAAQALDLNDYVHGRIRSLRDADAANGTDYFRTLLLYVRHGMSRSRTAAALYVHENTVAYRLKQIQGLIGLDIASVCKNPSLLQSLWILNWLDGGKKE